MRRLLISTVGILRPAILLFSLIVAGCATHNLPQDLGEGTCIQGDCNNGYGVMLSEDRHVKVKGVWRNGKPFQGEHQIELDGVDYSAIYEQGRLVEGTRLYWFSHGKYDRFTGKWETYYDPFNKVDINFPSEGVYYSSSGAILTGYFTPFPSRGFLEDSYEVKPDLALGKRIGFSTNVVFIGRVDFSGVSQMTVLAQDGHVVGSPFFTRYGSGLSASDEGILLKFKSELERELSEQSYASKLAKKKAEDRKRMFALAGGLLASAGAADAGLTVDSAAKVGKGTYALMADGDPSELMRSFNHAQLQQQIDANNQSLLSGVRSLDESYGAPGSAGNGPLYCKSGDICTKFVFSHAPDRDLYVSQCAQVSSCPSNPTYQCALKGDPVRRGKGTVDWTIYAYNGLEPDKEKMKNRNCQ